MGLWEKRSSSVGSQSGLVSGAFKKMYACYIVAGNGDYEGNITAQLAHHRLSKHWIYPAFHHAHQASTSSKTILQIYLIDTFIAVGWQQQVVRKHHRHRWMPPTLKKSAAFVNKKNANEQWVWLEKQLSQSQADYILVAGHLPLWSPCIHDDSGKDLKAKLQPLLLKYRVTAYLAGRDRCQAHLDDGQGLRQMLSGTGSFCCCDPTNLANIPPGSVKWIMDFKNAGAAAAGFMSITLNETSLLVSFHDESGKTLHVTPPLAPRGLRT
eukprot:GGOE01045316.1.p1 GENE.GGOE01045316.1~~GGOE01045316.1.p1  ORF type:complete len:267 (+),score=38.80 GGOE01045316.1:80-880(+)